MAIPDNPNWSELTDVKAYPQPGFSPPPLPNLDAAVIALGPARLNASDGKLNSRYWLVSQESGQVLIRGAL